MPRRHANAAPRIQYGGVSVRDAAGRALPAARLSAPVRDRGPTAHERAALVSLGRL